MQLLAMKWLSLRLEAFGLKNKTHYISLCDAFPRITRKKKAGVDFSGITWYYGFKQTCKAWVFNRDVMAARITHHFMAFT